MASSSLLWQEIRKGESKTLELKKLLPRREELAKTLVAFANTCGGKLIIGIDSDRQILGIQANEFELMDQIMSTLDEYCQPRLLPSIYFETLEGKTLIVVQVYPGNQLPYFIRSKGRDKGIYIRSGVNNRSADLSVINELERQSLNQSFDEQVVRDVNFKDLDLSSLKKVFEEKGKLLDKKQLHSLKLIVTEQGETYPTHGLMILLGLYEQVEIKCSRFKGTGMAVFLDKKEYRGNLFYQLEQADLFIKNHLHLKAEILGLRRTETFELPIPAIREALINALVHRDYSDFSRDIKVSIYDNTLNIISPGGLPHNITLDEAISGRSELRNRVLARVFRELGFIEQWGSGLARIRELCQQTGSQTPILKETADFFDVEFIRDYTINNIEDQSNAMDQLIGNSMGSVVNNSLSNSIGNSAIDDSLTERQKVVLQLIIQNPKISYRQMASELGINGSAVKKHLENLKEAGAVERIGGTRGYWKVKI